MIVAVAVAGAGLFIAVGLAWTARLVRIGTLDALELAGKLAVPEPVSALDWPELQVRAVVPQDADGERSLVLLLVEWPAHREQATLLVELGRADQSSLPLLSHWCAARASVSPTTLIRRRWCAAATASAIRSSIVPAARRKVSTLRRRSSAC